MIPTLRALFARDLQRLHAEIAAYETERALWQVTGTAPNAAGTLCLHLVGNLNTYVGATLGRTGYVRDRDAEFARKDVPQAELLRLVEATIGVVDHTLAALSEADLAQEFPVLVFAAPTSTLYLLVHLTTHLAYHLGQINYHRRLLDAP
jgi:uncharacterized damage-inducible protein DinB